MDDASTEIRVSHTELVVSLANAFQTQSFDLWVQLKSGATNLVHFTVTNCGHTAPGLSDEAEENDGIYEDVLPGLDEDEDPEDYYEKLVMQIDVETVR